MKAIFKTRFNRFLIVCFLVFVITGGAYEHYNNSISKPTDLYFYIDDKESETDVVSLENSVKSFHKRAPDRFGGFGLATYRGRCDVDYVIRQSPSSIWPYVTEYRGVKLCMLTGEDGKAAGMQLDGTIVGIDVDLWETRALYFSAEVDKLWMRYHKKNLKVIGLGIVKGFLAWVILLLSLIIMRWVLRGQETQS